jgi:hypothetical protein
LIAQNKEQQDQFKAMNLMLKEALAQQASIVSKLHDTETELLSCCSGRVNPKEKIQLTKRPGKWSNRSGQEPN